MLDLSNPDKILEEVEADEKVRNTHLAELLLLPGRFSSPTAVWMAAELDLLTNSKPDRSILGWTGSYTYAFSWT